MSLAHSFNEVLTLMILRYLSSFDKKVDTNF